MKYEMVRPCDQCPFLRKGGVRLRRMRIVNIVWAVLNWCDFSCHKTVEYDGDGDVPPVRGPNEQMCAGAMIFAEKHGCHMDRHGLKPLDRASFRRVFGSIREMLRVAL